MSRDKLMRVDPEFESLVRAIKEEFDFESNRRATKEIAYMFQKKKRKTMIL